MTYLLDSNAIIAVLNGRVRLIGSYDMQIAAIALANNLVIVTRNLREFTRIPGLAVENWQDP